MQPARSRTLALSLLAAAAALAGCRPAQPQDPNLVLDRGLVESLPSPRVFRREKDTAEARAADYEFQTFDGPPLSLRFSAPRDAYEAEQASWGYSDAELAALRARRDQARQDALRSAEAGGRSQAELDAELAAIQDRYKKEADAYMKASGFVVEPGGVARVDLARLARRSAPLVAELARQLQAQARERGRGLDWITAAATSFVQTALDYKEVPPVAGGRHVGGVWTPTRTLADGWGDCDTKAALLGAILGNFPELRMVIVELPDHDLLGLEGPPSDGQSFLRWGGRTWVLIEPAGPAWLPPGYLGDNTKALLAAGRAYVVSPVPSQ